MIRLDAGVVLCGGRSLRMGRDKARLSLGGATLLERAVSVLDALAPRVYLACGPSARYGELGRELVLDRRAGAGPLAGLEAALLRLEADGGGWLGVLACDMPRASAEVLALCLERASQGEHDVVLFATDAGLEPLCGVYHTRALAPIRRALDAGERRLISFHESTYGSVRVGTVPSRELPAALRAGSPACNVNTPSEWAAERRRGA